MKLNTCSYVELRTDQRFNKPTSETDVRVWPVNDPDGTLPGVADRARYDHCDFCGEHTRLYNYGSQLLCYTCLTELNEGGE